MLKPVLKALQQLGANVKCFDPGETKLEPNGGLLTQLNKDDTNYGNEGKL